MNILIACEESQRVCEQFRLKGHNAFSCDILKCSGGHPEWHIKGDVSKLLDGYCTFITMDFQRHHIEGEWDIIIAFPPCTHLAVSGAAWFKRKRLSGDNVGKSTCLWLKGLDPLTPTVEERPTPVYHEWVDKNGRKKRQEQWFYETRCLPHNQRGLVASKTFPGIAKAMADTWG